MKPSERLSVLGPRAFERATSVLHLAPSPARTDERLQPSLPNPFVALERAPTVAMPDRPELLKAELLRAEPAPADGTASPEGSADLPVQVGPPAALWSRAAKLHLTADQTAAAAFRIIVSESLAHLSANQDCARLNRHIEGVHQCRIALRRLRSAFRIFRPVLRLDHIRPLEQAVNWAGKVLGDARDLDVLSADLVVPAVEALGTAAGVAELSATLESERAVAYEAVSAALTNPRYGQLLVDLANLGSDRSAGSRDACTSPDRPVTEVALPALSLAHRKLLRRGIGFEALSAAERHKVRIALKRLRYALDFFAALFDGGSKTKYMKRVARLQDDLGRMNDVAASHRTLARVVGLAADDGRTKACDPVSRSLAFAAGGILGWHSRDAVGAERRMVKDWYAFARGTPFWIRQGSPCAHPRE